MANVSFGDAARGNLRALVETVDREITRLPLPGDGTPAADGLHASWNKLVKQLALGTAPETRQCPVCHSTGMRTASRCGNCWAKLEPLGALAHDEPHAAVLAAADASDPVYGPVQAVPPAPAAPALTTPVPATPEAAATNAPRSES
jgi:hypothetical protein